MVRRCHGGISRDLNDVLIRLEYALSKVYSSARNLDGCSEGVFAGNRHRRRGSAAGAPAAAYSFLASYLPRQPVSFAGLT